MRYKVAIIVLALLSILPHDSEGLPFLSIGCNARNKLHPSPSRTYVNRVISSSSSSSSSSSRSSSGSSSRRLSSSFILTAISPSSSPSIGSSSNSMAITSNSSVSSSNSSSSSGSESKFVFKNKVQSSSYSDYDFDNEEDDWSEEWKGDFHRLKTKKYEPVDSEATIEAADLAIRNRFNLSTYEWKFGSGIVNDFNRRKPHYMSDWIDGLKKPKKVISAVLFLYLTCLAPIVAFGGLTNIFTDGSIGVIDFILSCGLSGVIYSVFSGQPMTFLGPTGLTLAFITSLYQFTKANGLPFMGVYGWTGLWTSFFLALSALFNTSHLINLCTRFTDDCFNALIAINFLFEAFRSLLRNFTSSSVSLVSAFAAMNMAIGTLVSTELSVKIRRSKLFNYKVRSILSDFGPTLVLIIASVISLHPAVSSIGIERLSIPNGALSLMSRWRWTSDMIAVPMNIRMLSSIPAVLLTMLFFLDQNISVRAVSAFKLKKGDAYHLDLLLLASIVGGLSMFGLPWTCAATVQSLNHVRAMANVDVVDGYERWDNITETRLSAFLVHFAILSTVFIIPVLTYIPMPVISGLFLFLGKKMMKGNLYFERMGQSVMESKLLGDRNAYRNLKKTTVLKFIGIQSAMLLLIWNLKQSAKLALFFPSCIVILMLTRVMLLPRLFSKKDLLLLDPVM